MLNSAKQKGGCAKRKVLAGMTVHRIINMHADNLEIIALPINNKENEMAINQADILELLEVMCSKVDRIEFIYQFLNAYGLPKSAITLLRKGDKTRSVGLDGDVALNKKIYFKVLDSGCDLDAELEHLKANDVISKHDIRFVVVTDFNTLVAYDIKASDRLEVAISELPKEYGFFLPLAGYEKAIMHSEHPADIRASEKMGQLFDLIRARNDLTKREDIHALNVFLTRLLFCFYAEDTGIFTELQMTAALNTYTQKDGSDTDQFFTDLFIILNLPQQSEQRLSMPAHLQAFPYVNGGLFAVDEPVPDFGAKARRILLDCGSLDWSEINPDIFGSMFQAVIDEEQRSNLGQHYTSVSNIMKVIKPLFLDEMYTDLEKGRNSSKQLQALLVRVQDLRIFDPACGSGNFLIIAYKELRKLEMDVIDALNSTSSQEVMYYQSGIRLGQFYGIEIDDFAHEIATLSLWLAEHQMNIVFKAKFGYTEAALPLKESGNIVCGNSLQIDWGEICPVVDAKGKSLEVYICGNPPFLGTAGRSKEQTADMKAVFHDFKSVGYLDIVAAWLWKGAVFIEGHNSAKLAFVATSSICEGDQASTLWPRIFTKNLSIDFAYKTFPWSNSAKDNAGIHVVIVGLKNNLDQRSTPRIYEITKQEVLCYAAKNISPYLIQGSNLTISSRSKPFDSSKVGKMLFGNKPTDGGHLYLTGKEREDFIAKYPEHAHWVKKILGAIEFINNKDRWCFWLADIPLAEVMKVPEVASRCELIRALRIKAGHPAALKAAETPHKFIQIAQPKEGSYIMFPRVSSERRAYIPIGFMNSDIISNDRNFVIPNGTLYELGVLTSEMHNDWMRIVAGRLGGSYSYSNTVVYNTFPWPESTAPQRKNIEKLAEEVLLSREDNPDKTLAELYDPDLMPEGLLAAHKALDRAVDKLYRDTPFRDASERLEHLFNRYEKLLAEEKANKPAKKPKKKSVAK